MYTRRTRQVPGRTRHLRYLKYELIYLPRVHNCTYVSKISNRKAISSCLISTHGVVRAFVQKPKLTNQWWHLVEKTWSETDDWVSGVLSDSYELIHARVDVYCYLLAVPRNTLHWGSADIYIR